MLIRYHKKMLLCLMFLLPLKKIIRLETARYRFCENCSHARCFHPLVLSSVYGVHLTSASAQVSQTLLQHSSLMWMFGQKDSSLFPFLLLSKGSIFSAQSTAKTSSSVSQDGHRWWRVIRVSLGLWLSHWRTMTELPLSRSCVVLVVSC